MKNLDLQNALTKFINKVAITVDFSKSKDGIDLTSKEKSELQVSIVKSLIIVLNQKGIKATTERIEERIYWQYQGKSGIIDVISDDFFRVSKEARNQSLIIRPIGVDFEIKCGRAGKSIGKGLGITESIDSFIEDIQDEIITGIESVLKVKY